MLTFVATTAMLRTRPLCMARVVYVGRSRACAGRRGPAVVMDEQQYNLAATAYDILEGREFRRDALLQYGVFQRSQQLRILFFSSSSLVAAALPTIAGTLFPPSSGFDALGLAGCAASTLAFGYAGWNEKKTRGNDSRSAASPSSRCPLRTDPSWLRWHVRARQRWLRRRGGSGSRPT